MPELVGLLDLYRQLVQIGAGHTSDQISMWVGDRAETVRLVYAHKLEDSSKPAADTIDDIMSGIQLTLKKHLTSADMTTKPATTCRSGHWTT